MVKVANQKKKNFPHIKFSFHNWPLISVLHFWVCFPSLVEHFSVAQNASRMEPIEVFREAVTTGNGNCDIFSLLIQIISSKRDSRIESFPFIK